MITWVLDSAMQARMREKGCGGPTLAQAAQARGDKAILGTLVEGAVQSLDPMPGPYERVVVHGSIPFAAALAPYKGPGWHIQDAAGERGAMSTSAQLAFLGDDALNPAPTPTTWGALRTARPDTPIFIRPDAVWKAFAGQVLQGPDARGWDTLEDKDLPDDLPVLTAPIQRIQAEARHLVVDGQVITQSLYRWNERLDIRIDTHPDQDALARAIAARPGAPADVYVCDTALVGPAQGPWSAKVVEMNPFTCAGLYGMDAHAIAATFARRPHR